MGRAVAQFLQLLRSGSVDQPGRPYSAWVTASWSPTVYQVCTRQDAPHSCQERGFWQLRFENCWSVLSWPISNTFRESSVNSVQEIFIVCPTRVTPNVLTGVFSIVCVWFSKDHLYRGDSGCIVLVTRTVSPSVGYPQTVMWRARVLMDILLFCLCVAFHGHLRSSVAMLMPVI